MRGAIKVPWAEPNEWPSSAEEAHSQRVLMRLHRLIQAGYRPSLGGEAGGAPQVDLKHPNAQALTLWPDGQVLDTYPTSIIADEDRTIIHPLDDESFERFIRSVPRPNALSRFLELSVQSAILYGIIFLVIIVYLFWI
jgi:hypothetical protein